MRLIKSTKTFIKEAIKVPVIGLLGIKFRRKMNRYPAPYSLHLGCGSNHLEDWVNIDFSDDANKDVWWNLGQKIPLGNESCQYIFHEHVLEHFPMDRALDLLRECYRLLQPGGVLRVAMPSLDQMLEDYNDGNWKNSDSVHMPEVSTRAEYLNVLFRYWGHEWIYDREELHRRLEEVGFTEIHDVEIQQSNHAKLAGIEYRQDSLLICEAIKG